LVGRDFELATLHAAWRAAQTGNGKIVLISGEPGIGKTALLGRLVDQAAAGGARIAAGAAEELEQRVPFAAVADCLRRAAASGRRGAEITELIRGVGPEHCFLSEFWTKNQPPKEYAVAAGVGAFSAEMKRRGFTDRELEMMFKDNPARAIGLSVSPPSRAN